MSYVVLTVLAVAIAGAYVIWESVRATTRAARRQVAAANQRHAEEVAEAAIVHRGQLQRMERALQRRGEIVIHSDAPRAHQAGDVTAIIHQLDGMVVEAAADLQETMAASPSLVTREDHAFWQQIEDARSAILDGADIQLYRFSDVRPDSSALVRSWAEVLRVKRETLQVVIAERQKVIVGTASAQEALARSMEARFDAEKRGKNFDIEVAIDRAQKEAALAQQEAVKQFAGAALLRAEADTARAEAEKAKADAERDGVLALPALLALLGKVSVEVDTGGPVTDEALLLQAIRSHAADPEKGERGHLERLARLLVGGVPPGLVENLKRKKQEEAETAERATQQQEALRREELALAAETRRRASHTEALDRAAERERLAKQQEFDHALSMEREVTTRERLKEETARHARDAERAAAARAQAEQRAEDDYLNGGRPS